MRRVSPCGKCGTEIVNLQKRGPVKAICDECRRGPNRPGDATRGKGLGYRFLIDHKRYNSHRCLTWPYNRDDKGYGTLGYNGKIHKAHRLMCTLVHGKPPMGYQASHSCGRGHEGCVNPTHLSWKTNSENQIERYRVHGSHRRTKDVLSKKQQQEILRTCLSMKVREAAEKFGIKRGTVDYWRRKARSSQLSSLD